MSNKTIDLLPKYYSDVAEVKNICKANDKCLDELDNLITTERANLYLSTATDHGLSAREDIFKIKVEDKADLDNRRKIIQAHSYFGPFSLNFLKNELNSILGDGAYSLSIDHTNHILYVLAIMDTTVKQQITVLVNRIKPCNLVFSTSPYFAQKMTLGEQIGTNIMKWAYILDGSFTLDGTPFKIRATTLEIIQMSTTNTINSNLLNAVAAFSAGKIAKVVINDTVEITTFNTLSASGNTVTLSYAVLPSQVTEITNIKIEDADGNILVQSNLYVKIDDSTLFTHEIFVKQEE